MARNDNARKNNRPISGRSQIRRDDGKLRISPLFNDVFLKIFGSQDSKHVTRSLVNAILRLADIEEIDEVEQISADATRPGGIALKSPRTDVLVVAGEGDLVDLEAERHDVNVNNKLLYYASKLLSEHVPKGGNEDYDEIPRVVAITLLEGRTMFEGKEFVSNGLVRWLRGDELVDGSDRMAFVVVELDKVWERYTANSEEIASDESLARLYLLAGGCLDDEEADRIVGYFENIREFAERYRIAMDDPELKHTYDLYVESELEYNSRLHADQRRLRREAYEDGWQKGREDGWQKGREDGAVEVLAGLVRDGLLDESEAAERAGVTLEELREAIEQMGLTSHSRTTHGFS